MNEHLQVLEFNNPTANNQDDCNAFLKSIGKRAVNVDSFYNPVTGGVIYIVTYWS